MGPTARTDLIPSRLERAFFSKVGRARAGGGDGSPGSTVNAVSRGAEPRVVISASGRGTRLASVTKGQPKALLRLGNETILDRLIRAARTASRPVVLLHRPDDADLPAYVRCLHPDVETVSMRPRGYLRDLVDLWRRWDSTFSVIDCDLVCPVAALGDFLDRCTVSAADVAALVSRYPEVSDSRCIRPRVGESGLELVHGGDVTVPRTVGAYHLSVNAFAAAEAVTRAEGTFHDFWEALTQDTSLVCELFELPIAFNVNTPGDATAAIQHSAAWFEPQTARTE